MNPGTNSNYQGLDRHYSAPLLTPPLKFVMFFSSVWSSTSCGVFRGGGIFYRRCLTYIHRDPKKKKHEKKGKKCLLKRMASKETHDFQPFVKHQSCSLLPQIRSMAVAVWVHKMLRNLKMMVCHTKDQ
ncbi:uncharacterized protein DS421_12g381660 [Arachis hypogaea]|nr:uncharacterized protein DS421_12g381660 [Arachis hypogaea]